MAPMIFALWMKMSFLCANGYRTNGDTTAKKRGKHMFTCNGTIDPVVCAPVELQSVVDQLPQKRERAKERPKSHCISAKEGVLENLPE